MPALHMRTRLYVYVAVWDRDKESIETKSNVLQTLIPAWPGSCVKPRT